MLLICLLMCGLSLNVTDLQGHPLKEYWLSSSSYQLSIDPWLGLGFLCSPSCPMLGSYPTWVCTGLVHAVTSTEFIRASVLLIWKTLFPCGHPPHLALKIFLPHLRAEHAIVSSSLNFDKLWVSMTPSSRERSFSEVFLGVKFTLWRWGSTNL